MSILKVATSNRDLKILRDTKVSLNNLSFSMIHLMVVFLLVDFTINLPVNLRQSKEQSYVTPIMGLCQYFLSIDNSIGHSLLIKE